MTPTLFENYTPEPDAFDELFGRVGMPRDPFAPLLTEVERAIDKDFERLQRLADRVLLQSGVTFSVYADQAGTEKIFPFDLLPRVINATEWGHLDRGLRQRVQALQLFLDDVYGDQRILAEGIIPKELVLGAGQYTPLVCGIKPARGVRIHIGGIDMVRDGAGTWLVLEDNVRTPSGVSYVMENRLVTKRVFAAAFREAQVQRVDFYPSKLAESLRSVAPCDPSEATVVVLTPGMHNSAYFEHSFLARTMGLPLTEPGDLYVENDHVWLKMTQGPRRVDVIYRRIDDAFIDPAAFRPDTLLGVRGLIGAWAKGNVALANAPGNGVADDKAIYPYVPDMVRFYLSEEPILEQVPTWLCDREDERKYVLEHLDEMVVKSVDEAGGYGMLMGPSASKAERDAFAERIKATPRKYIAQHRLELSTCPTWIPETKRFEPRRVDLRPYILTGADGPWVLPGGLTRVALPKGSYVVNSSQGGGSKDTWVLR